MILYPNSERWFLNIASRNNMIIISDGLFFSFNWCSYFYFYGRMIFKPLLLREINISSKRFIERSYYLIVKTEMLQKGNREFKLQSRWDRSLTSVRLKHYEGKQSYNPISMRPICLGFVAVAMTSVLGGAR